MAQNDEDQNDKEQPTKNTVEKTAGLENGVETAVSKKSISFATLVEAAKQIQAFEKDVFKNPHAKEIFKLQVSNIALCLLAGVDIIPVIGEIDGLPKFLITAIDLADKGKKKGFFEGLYEGVPKVIKSLPVISELYPSIRNQFKTYQESLNFGKDVFKGASALIQKFVNPPAEVRAAKLQFPIQRMA